MCGGCEEPIQLEREQKKCFVQEEGPISGDNVTQASLSPSLTSLPHA